MLVYKIGLQDGKKVMRSSTDDAMDELQTLVDEACPGDIIEIEVEDMDEYDYTGRTDE